MRRGVSLAIACLGVVSVASAQHGTVRKNPESKLVEAKKYMEPVPRGMAASVRMKGYQQRLQMEAASPFANIKWRSVGPEIQGGRVIDFDVPEQDQKSLYVSFATGGLWRSTNYGQNWTPLFDNESAFAIGDTAVSKDGKTIWVGTGENNSQRTSYSGTGVFKSTDSGKTWQHMGLEETHRIGRVLIDPRNDNTVYVGAIGSLYTSNPARGVFKTTDGGKTWNQVLKLDDLTGVIDMAMDPRNPDVIYAAAWERDRRAWNFREGGPGSAIYKTVDGGKTWNKLTNGLPPAGDVGRIGLAVAPSKPNVVYAFYDNQGPDEDTVWKDEYQPGGVLTANRYYWLTEEEFVKVPKDVLAKFADTYLPRDTKIDDVVQQITDKKITLKDVDAMMVQRNANVFANDQGEAQVYRSDDSGKTWRKTHRGNFGEHGGYYGGRIVVAPTNENTIWITGVSLLRSDNGGKSFYTCTGRDVHVDFHMYWVSPSNPAFHATGSDGGLYFSFDDGKSWDHKNSMPVGQFTTIAVDTKTPYNIYGGLQDNGTMKGPSNYRPGISDLSLWKEINGGDGSAVAVDPRDGGDLVYVAFQWGQHTAIDQKNNKRWNTRPGGSNLRFQWISPFIISPHHPDIVYCGAQKLFRSFNQGRKWEAISDDLTTNRENGDVPYATIKEVSESPFKFGTIVIGTDDGLVKITRDSGATWQDISTPAKGKWVSRVICSKYDAGTIIVSQNGYREDDWTPLLWKSTDYGQTWKSIVGNLPPEPINVVREDPTHENMLFVGTDLGVFVSYNGGDNWEPLSGGIPRTPVHDLVIQEDAKELVIASHARSVWVLKLDKVYDLDDDLRKTDLKIWPVDDMNFSDRWPYRRVAEYSEKTADPPKVAGQYWSKAAGKATLRVKDKDGKVVKEMELNTVVGYNSFEFDVQLQSATRFVVTPKPPKTAEEVVKDPYEVERPKFMAKGEYKIEIAVGDKTQSIDWKLK
ncbi:MAG: hypothetical protein U0S12_09050 [Fimbriimonadales bacterium]